MFIPGETITHRFYIPFSTDNVSKIYVSYRQDNKLIFQTEVSKQDIQSEGINYYFEVLFTQEQSLLFKNNNSYTVQLNVALESGKRCTSIELKGENGVQHIREVVAV